MSRHGTSSYLESYDSTFLRTSFVASLIAATGALWPVVIDGAEKETAPTENVLRAAVPWLPQAFTRAGETIAFEEHADFMYLCETRPPRPDPSANGERFASFLRIIYLRPATVLVDVFPFDPEGKDVGQPRAASTVRVSLGPKRELMRSVYVYDAPEQRKTRKTISIRANEDGCEIDVAEAERRFHVSLPMAVSGHGRIAIDSTTGDSILPGRRFPAGIMPGGRDGMRMIEQWDSRYRRDSRPDWDKGFPSTHLMAAVEKSVIKPGRAVVLGCGTGTNAIYLAERGFNVTAIDIAPTALELAEEKAEKAGVKVRWLLADVLAPPLDLDTFDFVFDRGCYHGVRRIDAEGYVASLKQLTVPGSRVLILAGNANEERHYGPPRVKEEEIRFDFSPSFDFVQLDTVRFDSSVADRQGALAWAILLRRKAVDRP